jgi:hypothetical protein
VFGKYILKKIFEFEKGKVENVSYYIKRNFLGYTGNLALLG